MTALNDSCRSLASPSVFEEVLDGGGALSGREEWAEEADYDSNARKLDFEGHLRALVLLHTTAYETQRRTRAPAIRRGRQRRICYLGSAI